MKLRITLIITALFVSFNINAQTKVGTVDSEYIISRMPQLKAVQERTRSYGSKLDSTFNLKVKEYDAKVDAYNKAVKTLNEEDKKKRFNEIAALDQDMKKFKQNGSKMMQIRNDELMVPLYKKLSEVISEVAKANGYTQILTITGNEFGYIDLKYDITKLVMNKLGIKEEAATKK